MAQSSDLLGWLRAAAEPTRLRLLALCSHRACSVSDLAELLGQSEPRVSRHLRILCDAGLLERLRHGQWVHYGVVSAAPAAAFVQGLLGQVDRGDRLLERPPLLARLDKATEHASAAFESRLGRALGAFVAEQSGGKRWKNALLVGVTHLELLDCIGRLAAAPVALADSRRAAQAARAFAERAAVNCRIHLSSGGAIGEPGAFEAVLVDHLVVPRVPLPELLAQARGVLRDDGILFFFERYDALDGARDRIVEHPLARMRRVLAEAGFACRKLSPIEADGEHVLAAFADVSAAAEISRARAAG